MQSKGKRPLFFAAIMTLVLLAAVAAVREPSLTQTTVRQALDAGSFAQ